MENLESEKVTREQFQVLTRPLIGLPISKTWCGHGSAIFLEIGQLSKEVRLRKDGSQRVSHRGECGVMIEWSWRVERARSVSFGSSTSEPVFRRRLSKLEGLEIVQVTVEGRLPELVIQLSGGYWLRSFMPRQGQPQWCLFFNNGVERDWIVSRNGGLWKESPRPEASAST